MATIDDWAAFLGKTGTAVKATRVKGSNPVTYTEAEFAYEAAKKVDVADEEGGKTTHRPVWAWSLMETAETGIRRSWMSGRVLEDGQCMIHIEGNWSRGIHIAEVPAQAWHLILGQPHGGDSRILGQMKARWTREAKKQLAMKT